MNKAEILELTKEFLQKQFSGESSGHDWFHIERVWKLSKTIAAQEGNVDFFVVEMGALLHDIADHKFFEGDEKTGPKKAEEFLNQFDLDQERKKKIVSIVDEISYKGAQVKTPMSSKEGMIVQDADRLDAIGAIGIARTFAYGGSKNRPIYDPMIKPVCHTSFAAYKTSTAPTINHFYEKLLLLKDRMNTNTARNMAERRHNFLQKFLEEFYSDWNCTDS